MKLFYSRKGQELLLKTLSALLIIVIVIFVVLSYTRVVKSSTAFDSEVFKKDIGFLVEVLPLYEEDMQVNYRNTGRFGFRFTSTRLELYEDPFSMGAYAKKKVYRFIVGEDITVNRAELKPKKRWENRENDEDPEATVALRFCKVGDQILVVTLEESCYG